MDSKLKVSKKRIAFQISQSLRDELKSEALKCSMSLDKFIENALEEKVSGFFGQDEHQVDSFALSKFDIKS